MSFCPYCGNPIADGARFCTGCGKPVAAQQGAAACQEPVAAAVATEIVVPVKTKVLGFVGMGLAIAGLFFAALGTLYALIGIGEEGLGFGMAVGFGMFSVPCSIVGKILSEKSAAEGFYGTPTNIGSKLGLFGIIASAVMMTLGLINLFV